MLRGPVDISYIQEPKQNKPKRSWETSDQVSVTDSSVLRSSDVDTAHDTYGKKYTIKFGAALPASSLLLSKAHT